MWFGAVCPWATFLRNDIIPIYRLIILGILVLVLRRLPAIFAMHRVIRQIEQLRQALFVGFFGPVGVSAIFYLYVSQDFLKSVTIDGAPREDAEKLSDAMNVIVWFLAICSIVVHGLSVPLGKVGYHLPRTFSNIQSRETQQPTPFRVRGSPGAEVLQLRNTGNPGGNAVVGIGGTTIAPRASGDDHILGPVCQASPLIAATLAAGRKETDTDPAALDGK